MFVIYAPDSGIFHQSGHMTLSWQLIPQCRNEIVLWWALCGFSQHAFLPHLLSVWSSPSQAHGSGGPEELHLLAESEPRRHGVRCAGLCHVQSASQAAVIGQRETATRSRGPSADSALCPLYLKDSRRLVDHHTRLVAPQISLPTTQARKNEQNLHFICIESVLVLFML